MSDWCLAHPWMTFLVAMTLASSVSLRIVWNRKSKEKQ